MKKILFIMLPFLSLLYGNNEENNNNNNRKYSFDNIIGERNIQIHTNAMFTICKTEYNHALQYSYTSNFIKEITNKPFNKETYIELQNELKEISPECKYNEFREFLLDR